MSNKVDHRFTILDHFPATKEQTIDINVDQSLQALMVSVAGENPELKIFKPSKEEYNNYVKSINLDNIKIVEVDKPEPGNWTFNAKTKSLHTLTLSALTELKFNYGFATHKPNHIEDTSFQPLELMKNIFIVEPSNDSLIGNLTAAKFIIDDSMKIVRIPLKLIRQQNESKRLFISDEFTPSNDSFKVYVNF